MKRILLTSTILTFTCIAKCMAVEVRDYNELKSALSNTSDGDTITFTQDITGSGSLTVSKAVTIDGNENVYDGNGKAGFINKANGTSFENITFWNVKGSGIGNGGAIINDKYNIKIYRQILLIMRQAI